jgi:hypothetical protein
MAETKRLASTTERTPMSERSSKTAGNHEPEWINWKSRTGARIVIETAIIFGILLLAWWGFVMFFSK